MADAVYVISGWMRSGTSMMMRALEAGGMEACYSGKREIAMARYSDDDYLMNPAFYELDRSDYQKPDFPHGYEGKLVKALQLGPANMRTMPGGIRVVFMRRPAEEQRQSYMAAFKAQAPTVEQIEARVERAIEAARNRRDTEVLELEYANVIEEPRQCLAQVGLFFGRKLDLDAAAAVIDPNLYRYKLAELEIGVV